MVEPRLRRAFADVAVAMDVSPSAVVDPSNGTPGSQSVAADPRSGQVLVRDLEGSALSSRLHRYDPATDRWTTTDLVVDGHHPPFSVVDGRVLVPDEAAPVVGVVPGGDQSG